MEEGSDGYLYEGNHERDEVKFCLQCGRPLDKLNRSWTGKVKDFCNKTCKRRYERSQRPKNRPKYGVAGSCYDFYPMRMKT